MFKWLSEVVDIITGEDSKTDYHSGRTSNRDGKHEGPLSDKGRHDHSSNDND